MIGCGRISTTHIEAAREAGATVVGVCDKNAEVAQARADASRVDGCFADAGEMMARAKPDVVHLLTPPGSRPALVELAAAHGAHCYVEKPFAGSEADARSMIATARSAGIRLCPGHNRLFQTEFQEAVRRIRAGEIGRVLSVRAEQGYSYEKAARGASIPWAYQDDWGVYENLMPHPLYVATLFLAEPGEPRIVAADLGRVSEAAVEELHVLIPSVSAVGEVVLSLNAAPERNRVEIVGTQGRAVVDFLAMTCQLVSASGLPSVITRFTNDLSTARQLVGGVFGTGFGMATGRVKRYPGIRRLVAAFYRSIAEGGPSPVPEEDGLRNVILLERIRLAASRFAKTRVSLASGPASIAPRVLVTGATGFVGRSLTERLSSDGVPVRATTRLAARVQPRPSIQWVRCDLGRDSDLRTALEGIETVYHCAAVVGSPSSPEEYKRVNVDGTLRVANLAAEAGVKRLVYLSSIGVYATAGRFHGDIDESFPYDARAAERGPYTQTKLEAERALLDWVRSHPSVRVVILRPGTIYGPGAELPVGRLKLPSSNARPFVAGGGGVPMPLAYVANVVDAMLAAAGVDVPTGSVFNVVDAPDADQGAVRRALRTASNGRIRPVFVPYPIVWSLMLALDFLSAARGKGVGTNRYRLKRTLAPMRFPSLAARGTLGWRPRVAIEEGLRLTLDATRETPFPH